MKQSTSLNDFIENFNFLIFIFFCFTDVSNYREERKIKLLINAYIKISRNLGGNFLDFWQFFGNFLEFQRVNGIITDRRKKAKNLVD